MTRICFLFLFSLIFTGAAFAQKSMILDNAQIEGLFPESILKTLKIDFPIQRVYKYSDVSGIYYCVLTESRDEIRDSNDTINYKIKAITVRSDNGSLTKIWEINDFVLKANSENSIWFWTKYSDFKDYDGDGLTEPVIVYGTSGVNGFDDGRVKFIIYYKGQKFAIRHQNGTLDGDRTTQVDQGFYGLPQQLQSSIRQKIDLMEQNNNALFPGGWQLAMKNKKTIIKE